MEKPPYLRFNFGDTKHQQGLGAQQIVVAMRQQLLSEHDFSGCRLPPVRVLAHQLGVSKNTVQSAYDELKAQGLIEGRNRSGLYVCQREDRKPHRTEHSLTAALPPYKNLPFTRATKNATPLSLSSVHLDPRILPQQKLSECFRSVLKNPGLQPHNDPHGHLPLRQKIAERLSRRGMEVGPHQVILTHGSQGALDLVTRCLATDTVATEDPAYSLGKQLLEFNGLKTVGLPIDPFQGAPLERWREIINDHRPGLLYLTSNFQNPNGYSYTSSEIRSIVQWSQEFGYGILEDDWGSDMLSYSEFRPGFRALGGEHVLYMNSFTKKLWPSLRLGYLVVPPTMVDTLVDAKRLSSVATPSLIEQVVFEFLDRGYYDTFLKQVQKELDQRYLHCISILRELMPPQVTWTAPGGGPVLWLQIPPHFSLSSIIEKMREEQIDINCSEDAYFKAPTPQGFKIGYAYLNPAEMRLCLEKLGAILQRQ